MKEDEMDGACGTCGKNGSTYGVYMGKYEVQRQNGKPTHVWEDKFT
jgi:hypothetical protein